MVWLRVGGLGREASVNEVRGDGDRRGVGCVDAFVRREKRHSEQTDG